MIELRHTLISFSFSLTAFEGVPGWFCYNTGVDFSFLLLCRGGGLMLEDTFHTLFKMELLCHFRELYNSFNITEKNLSRNTGFLVIFEPSCRNCMKVEGMIYFVMHS